MAVQPMGADVETKKDIFVVQELPTGISVGPNSFAVEDISTRNSGAITESCGCNRPWLFGRLDMMIGKFRVSPEETTTISISAA